MHLVIRSLLLVLMLAACSVLSAGQANSWVDEDTNEWSLTERMGWSGCPVGYDVEPDEQVLADAHSRLGHLQDDDDHQDVVDDACVSGQMFSVLDDSAGKPQAQVSMRLSRWPTGLFRPPQA